ncbi:hypothetical protein GCM10010335_32940 [Streptomyces galbus]|nr:hypothetical protein GCM10010335_32940 [Streptomyces galbus]
MAWAAPSDWGGRKVTAGIARSEDEHASLFQVPTAALRQLLRRHGDRVEPNRLSVRLFDDVARRWRGGAEVTEIQVQM